MAQRTCENAARHSLVEKGKAKHKRIFDDKFNFWLSIFAKLRNKILRYGAYLLEHSLNSVRFPIFYSVDGM